MHGASAPNVWGKNAHMHVQKKTYKRTSWLKVWDTNSLVNIPYGQNTVFLCITYHKLRVEHQIDTLSLVFRGRLRCSVPALKSKCKNTNLVLHSWKDDWSFAFNHRKPVGQARLHGNIPGKKARKVLSLSNLFIQRCKPQSWGITIP